MPALLRSGTTHLILNPSPPLRAAKDLLSGEVELAALNWVRFAESIIVSNRARHRHPQGFTTEDTESTEEF